VVIVSVLLAIIVPSVMMIKDRGNSVKCISNLRQLSVATMQYASDSNGRIPNYFTSKTLEKTPVAQAASVGQWYWHIAPYVNIPR
jgi:type II secretory pathway pseudopilin PulG